MRLRLREASRVASRLRASRFERFEPCLGSSLSRAWGQVLHSAFAQLDSVRNRNGLSIMARPLRLEFAGALYHVTARSDRREAIYEDDEDRQAFLDVLAEVADRFNWLV